MKKTLILAAFVAAVVLACVPVWAQGSVPEGTTVVKLSPPVQRSPEFKKWIIEGIELNEAGKQDLFYKSAPFATRADVQRAVAKLQPLSRRALRRADSAMVTANEALKKAVAAEEKIEKVAKATEMVGDFVVRVNNKAVAATNIAWIALIIAIVALAGIGGLILMAVKAQKQSAVPEPTKEEPSAGEVDAPPSG